MQQADERPDHERNRLHNNSTIIRRKGFSAVDKAWAVQALGYDAATKLWGPAMDDPESGRPWSNTSIAKKLGSSKTTISGWRKRASLICEAVVNAPARKRARGATYPEIEDALTRFYFTTRAMGKGRGRELYFTNLSLKEKALALQKSFVGKIDAQIEKLPVITVGEAVGVAERRATLGEDGKRLAGFKASNGWLAKWKKRAGVPSPKRGRPSGVEQANRAEERMGVKKTGVGRSDGMECGGLGEEDAVDLERF